jgi:hypothetical protein
MALATILLLAALVLFVVDAFGVATRINLQSAGLACFVGALLAGGAAFA